MAKYRIHVFLKVVMCSNSMPPVNIFPKNNFTSLVLVLAAGIFFATPSARSQTEAQPALPTLALTLGGKNIHAEIADDNQERATGLMFRKSLATDSGMLFVMPQIGPAAFWMRNTEIPLTIAYIDPSGVILELHDLEPRSEKTVSSQFPNIAFALEMSQGWFSKNNIWPGDRIGGLPSPAH